MKMISVLDSELGEGALDLKKITKERLSPNQVFTDMRGTLEPFGRYLHDGRGIAHVRIGGVGGAIVGVTLSEEELDYIKKTINDRNFEECLLCKNTMPAREHCEMCKGVGYLDSASMDKAIDAVRTTGTPSDIDMINKLASERKTFKL